MSIVWRVRAIRVLEAYPTGSTGEGHILPFDIEEGWEPFAVVETSGGLLLWLRQRAE